MSLAEIKEAVAALSPAISQSWLSSFASVKTWHGTTRSMPISLRKGGCGLSLRRFARTFELGSCKIYRDRQGGSPLLEMF